MPDKPPRNPAAQNPVDIARETFRQLAIRKIAPTPDAYRKVYDEIAGYAAEPTPEQVFGEFATTLLSLPDEVSAVG
ncbi:MAG TPA: GGDEF domain-containing protein, partial [Oxalicibacterium sp.]|nr:GGDEF domain-containing protein [Oxalicibacterium sp.]